MLGISPPDDAPRPHHHVGLTAGAFAVAAGALLLHIARYRDFLADDALISLRYARRLLEGLGLTWTDGPRVEGYSNLLWILITAGLGRMGVDLVAAARWMGVASAMVMVAVVVWARPGRAMKPQAAWVAALTVALSAPVAVWAASGMEATLVAALATSAVVLALPLADERPNSARSAMAASVPLALLVLTRPDGVLFTAALVFSLVVALGPRPGTLRLAMCLAVLPAVAWTGEELFRISYYHSWVPNSARVKIAFTLHRLETGLRYVGAWLFTSWPLAVFAITGAVLARGREERARSALVLGPIGVWIAYVASVGGDFFPGFRHLVPVAGLLALIAAQAVDRLARIATRGRTLAFVAILLISYGLQQLGHHEYTRARRETWVWSAGSVARTLRSSFGAARPLIAVTAAGSFPYWTRFPSLDMLGLNDAHVARHPTRDFGHGWAGHELGDARYVLERDPDLIQFSAIRGSEDTGHFRVEQELARDPVFRARYRLVTFEVPTPSPARWRLWVRRESPRIGIVRDLEHVRVPAFLLDLNPAVTSTPDPEGRFGVGVSSERPPGIGDLALARGKWTVSFEPDSPALFAAVRSAGDTGAFYRVAAAREIVVDQDARLDLLVSHDGPESLHVRRILFARRR